MLSPQLLELTGLWWHEGRRRSVLLPHGWRFRLDHERRSTGVMPR